MGRGRTRARRAEWRFNVGADPTPDLDAAQADYDDANRLSVTGSPVFMRRGDLRAARGVLALARAEDAVAHFAAAEADLGEQLARSTDRWVFLLRGTMRTGYGRALAARGQDPLPIWTDALRDLDKAAPLLASYTEPLVRRAELRLWRADYLARRDPAGARADLAAAAPEIERAIEIEPTLIDGWVDRALLRRQRGELALAREDLRRAIERRPALAGMLPPPLASLQR
jgi:tetratricopeptide (TPR) repeat protein